TLGRNTWSSALTGEPRQNRPWRNSETAPVILAILRSERACVGNHRGIVCAGAKIRHNEIDTASLAESSSALAETLICGDSPRESDSREAFTRCGSQGLLDERINYHALKSCREIAQGCVVLRQTVLRHPTSHVRLEPRKTELEALAPRHRFREWDHAGIAFLCEPIDERAARVTQAQ